MTLTRQIIALSLALVALIGVNACSSLTDITNSLTSLQKMQFKVSGLTNMRLAGVDVSRVANPTKLGVADALALTSAFSRKSLPTTFTLNVDARNPNSGGKGTRSVPLTLSGFEWQLLLDDKRTVSGDLERAIEIPGTSAATTIPLAVSLDMYQFFADRGYDGIVNLALALGGVNGSTSKVKLDAKPTVGTPFGPMSYPGRITIVDTEFRGS